MLQNRGFRMMQLLCASVILGLLVKCTAESPAPLEHQTKTCPETEDCPIDNSECSNYTCKCKLDYGGSTCSPCPGFGKECTDCCSEGNICIKICNCEYSDCRGTTLNDEFILAAQIALGSALLIVVIALFSLIWKTFSRRRQLQRARVRRAAREQRVSDNSSVGSEQLYVVQRLRDRPPRYDEVTIDDIEKPPTYQESTAPQTGRYSLSIGILGEPSPPYTFQAPPLSQYSNITTLPPYQLYDTGTTTITASGSSLENLTHTPEPQPSEEIEHTSRRHTTELCVQEFLSTPNSRRQVIGEVVNPTFLQPDMAFTDLSAEHVSSDSLATTTQLQTVPDNQNQMNYLQVQDILSTPESRRRTIRGLVNPAFQRDSTTESELHM